MVRPRPRVVIDGSEAGRRLEGRVVPKSPGAVVEAENASTAPLARVRPREAVRVAVVDERGCFAGEVPGELSVRAGDALRVRARTRSGLVGPWTVLRAQGVPGAPRAPSVALFRIGIRALEGGVLAVFNLHPKGPVGEPGATLSFSNTRTGARAVTTLDDAGTFRGRVLAPGIAGDVLQVEVLGHALGPLRVPPASSPRGRLAPSAQHQRLGFIPGARRIEAPLFAGRPLRPLPGDVFQSELQDCYLASAAAALAHASPEVLLRAIARVKPGTGTYRVRFNVGRARETTDVVVTDELYVRPSGELLYGASAERGEAPSLWWPLLEKAFATLHGSYRRIGEGGTSHRVLSLLTGRAPRHFWIDGLTPDSAWERVAGCVTAGLPLVVGTFPPATAARYRGTGLVPDHAYAVLACDARSVTVRNPWGDEPGGASVVPIEDFVHLFQVASTVN